MQVGMRQLIELVAGGTFTTGIFGTTVCTVEVARVGDGQGELPHPFGPVKDTGVRDKPLLYGVDEMFFYIVESYDIAEIHQ